MRLLRTPRREFSPARIHSAPRHFRIEVGLPDESRWASSAMASCGLVTRSAGDAELRPLATPEWAHWPGLKARYELVRAANRLADFRLDEENRLCPLRAGRSRAMTQIPQLLDFARQGRRPAPSRYLQGDR
jgi:hypothetical protein